METSYSLLSTDSKMNLLLLYRRSLPNSQLIFIVITYTKFIPIILFTHAIPSNTSLNLLTLSKIIRAFITFKSTSINYSYTSICIIIYIICILIVINVLVFIIMFKRKAKVTDQIVYEIPNNNIKISKTMKIIFKIVTYIILLFALFYQNVMEILYREMFLFFVPLINQIKNNFNEQTLRSFEKTKNVYVLILNVLFFIISLIIISFFHLLTQMKTLTRTYGFKSPLGKLSSCISILMFSLLGFYSTMFTSASTHSNAYDTYFIIFTYIYVCLLFLNSILNTNFILQSTDDAVYKVYFHLNNFCFVSGVFEIIIYHTLPSKIHSQKFYLTLLITDIIITITYNWILKSLCYKKFSKRFIFSFFSMTKHNKVYDYYNFFNYLNSFHNEISTQFTFIYSLYLHHINICNEDSCQCHLITNKHCNININELKVLVDYFSIIAENKISNEILTYTFKEGNTSSNLGELLVMHVDYLFSVKHNIPLTLYLCQFYLLQYKKELSFQEAYTIYEINYIVYTKYKENKHLHKGEVSFIKKNLIREKIEKIIMRICICFEKFYYFKTAKNNQSKIFYTCEDVLEVFGKFVKEKKLLVHLIKESMRIDLFKNLNELKIMLVYFTNIIRVKLPKCSFNYMKDINVMNQDNNDKTLMGTNYNYNKSCSFMILYLKTDNKFIIRYASPEILTALSYKKKEFIGMDFHSLLILPEISDYHNIYMKQFVLYGYYSYIKRTFVLNKQQKLVPVNVKVKVLPTKSSLVNIVMELIFQEHETFDQHFLILDSAYQVANISQSVENKFVFTLEMLQNVKFNFCDFFGINKDKMMTTFQDYIVTYHKHNDTKDPNKKNKNHPKIKNIVSDKNNNNNKNIHNNENNISYYHGFNKHDIMALPSVKKDEIYYYHDIDLKYFKNSKKYNNQYQSNINGMFVPPRKIISYNEMININKIKSSIIRMVKNLNELGLEKEWKERLELLYFKLTSINLTESNFKQEQQRLSTLGNLTVEGTPQQKDNFSINSYFLQNALNIPNDYLHISFHLKTIANLYYIIMTISEQKKEESHVEICEYPFPNINYECETNKENVCLNISAYSPNNEKQLTQNLLKLTPSSVKSKLKVQFYTDTTTNTGEDNSIDNCLRTGNRDTSDIMLAPSDSTGLFLGNSGSINLSQAQLIKSTNNRKSAIGEYTRMNSKKLEQLKQELPELFSKQHFNSRNNSSMKYSQTSSKNAPMYLFHINNATKNEKTNFLEKVVFYGKTIVLISIIVVVILNITNLILSNHLTQFSLNLFHINAYTCLIANDIYYGSLLALTTCLHDEGLQETNLLNLDEKILQSSNDLINHYHQLTSYINILINEGEIDTLFSILNQKDQYKYVLPNWQKAFRESCLNDEIYSIHFYLKRYNVFQSTRYCRVRSIFIDKNKTDIFPTQEEELIYYIIGNTVGTISDLIEQLMKEVNNLLMNNNNSTNTKTLIIKVVILFIVVSLFIMDMLILRALSLIFLHKIMYLFSPLDNEKVFFDEITKFKSLLINSDSYDNKHLFSNKPLRLFYSDTLYNMGSSSISINSSSMKATKINGKGINKSKGSSKRKEYSKGFQRQNEYNKMKNRKHMFDNGSTIIHINNTDDSKDDDDDMEDGSQKGSNNFVNIIQPKILILFLVLISIVYIVYLAIEVISIYTTSSENKGLSIENQFATNFLNRVPKIYELILYSITSVFMNEVNYITKPQDIYDDYILSNQYGITLNLESNSFFALFHESNYAYLYYQLYIIRQNLLRFINDRSMSKYLHQTTLSEFKFNDGESFCIYAPLEYVVNYYSNITDHVELLTLLNKETNKCRTVGKGINLSGYSAANDLILELLTTLYHTFKTGIYESRQEIFLKSADLFLIIDDAINVLRILHFADAYLSIGDVKNTYRTAKNYTAFFSVILIIFSIFAVIGISLMTLIVFMKTISITQEMLNDFYVSVKKCKANVSLSH